MELNRRSAGLKTRTLLIIVRLFFFLVFFDTCAQEFEVPISKMDTIHVLNGRLHLLLKSSTYKVMSSKELLEMYSASFNIGQIQYTDGFKIGENSTLTFYQTSIENLAVNDGSVSTWKLIESFTDKIPKNQWLKSGWSRMTNGDFMYSVKLVSNERPQLLSRFVFYYIDNKLSFSLFQCPVQTLEINPGEPEKYMSVVANDPPHSRFTGSKKK